MRYTNFAKGIVQTTVTFQYDAITFNMQLLETASAIAIQTIALTGTDGTAAKFNVSCFTDGKLYFENQIGSTGAGNGVDVIVEESICI